MRRTTCDRARTISKSSARTSKHPARISFLFAIAKRHSRPTSPQTLWCLSLNGSWKFRYSDSPAARPIGFQAPDYDVSAWNDIPVPANWERHGHGYPICVSVPYPFETDEPNVPTDDNPVGSCRRDFDVPNPWDGEAIFLEFGAVSSAF